MGNTYFWDIGFNFNEGEPRVGLVIKDDSGSLKNQDITQNTKTGQSGPSYHFHEGDVVNIHVFDITGDGQQTTLQGGSIYFSQTPNSPFSDAQTIALSNLGSPIIGNSSFFRKPYPGWMVLESATVINDGRFPFTVALEVKRGEMTKIINDDPEMIVESAG